MICLRLLTQRARSRAELAQALAHKGVPDDAAGRVLDRFREVGLIDDEALAIELVQAQHRERGLARRSLAVKLRQRGLAEQVPSALSVLGDDQERARARELVEKRQHSLQSLPAPVQVRRLVGLLARKGYSPSTAYSVVREVLGASAEAADGPDFD